MPQLNDSEINFFQLLETLWKGKWKIISSILATTILGAAFIYYLPSSYKVETPIKKGKTSVFFDYMLVNNILEENNLLITDQNSNGYLISSQNIFEKFMSEFNDYEEMITVLQKNEFVNQTTISLDDTNKRKQLINYAKSFKIKVISFDEKGRPKNSELSFVWHDPTEGKNLLNRALLLTLNKIKQTLIEDIYKLAKSIDMKIKLDEDLLNFQLDIIEKKQELEIKRRIKYLKEHSDIAKEIQVDKNLLYPNSNFPQYRINNTTQKQKQTEQPLFSTNNSYNFPYYLRGYKAIDKEISLVKKRSKNEQLLMADGYVFIKNKLLLIKNDLSSSQLKKFARAIENDNPEDWVQFNLELADSKSQKNSMLYFTFFTFFGGIIGILYVLISKNVTVRENFTKNS